MDLSHTIVQFICLLLNHGAGLRDGKKLGDQFGLQGFGVCGYIDALIFKGVQPDREEVMESIKCFSWVWLRHIEEDLEYLFMNWSLGGA